MPTDVVMPQMGESITEGTITKWLKKPGDTIQRDEPLFEISTDKVDAEIPSPSAGTLKEIKIPEGTTVQINTVVSTIDEAGSASAVGPSSDPGRARKGRNGSRPSRGQRHSRRGCDARRHARQRSYFRRPRHRSLDAADGRVHHRRHHHQVAQKNRRYRSARRTHLRDLDR